MTMPTLINQTNGAQYRAAYKKALSAISQGVTLNVALDDKSFADEYAETFLPTRMNVVKTADSVTAPTGGDALPSGTPNKILYFNDSSMFAFTKEQKCASSGTINICKGYIDVNGDKGPNKVVSCSTGTTAFDEIGNDGKITQGTDCTVTSPTDVYPVYYYDQTIVPATNAARAVLYGK